MMSKTFVTGVYASGKTYFAKEYARAHDIPFISFDELHDYASKDNQSKAILRSLPSSFVIDAIPIDENAGWSDFAEYQANNNVVVVCVYCAEAEWVRRLSTKFANRAVGKGPLESAKQWMRRLQAWENRRSLLRLVMGEVRSLRSLGDVAECAHRSRRALRGQGRRIDINEHLREYRGFFIRNLPLLRSFRDVRFYDSCAKSFTSERTMLDRIQYKSFPLKDRLAAAGPNYDVSYQDIEVLSFVGYSESYRTWENIEGLVDWVGKTVGDLGCFHGYFSFKVEDCGGIVRGLDRSKAALETARMINDIRGGSVIFTEWFAGDDIPCCDVILCLNSLHHFGDGSLQEKVLSKMNCDTAIFELNLEQIPVVHKYFGNVREFQSHREGRVILLCSDRLHVKRRSCSPDVS